MELTGEPTLCSANYLTVPTRSPFCFESMETEQILASLRGELPNARGLSQHWAPRGHPDARGAVSIEELGMQHKTFAMGHRDSMGACTESKIFSPCGKKFVHGSRFNGVKNPSAGVKMIVSAKVIHIFLRIHQTWITSICTHVKRNLAD